MKTKTSQQKHGSLMLAKEHFLAIVALVVLSACFAFLLPRETEAVTTVPTRMNFQGRLADSTGNIKTNGTYNMRLRLYTVASAGTPVWTEDRLVSAGQGVTLTNGLFALQLGSVTSLPASLFASGPLYLEVELPTPATATSSTPSWTEGAMTPRNQMATSAYAYNSELLDGEDGDYYRDATNLNAGTLNSARISGSYTGLTGTGALAAGTIANGFGTITTGNTIQGSRLISTVATGTAPLTVTSTTAVTNLNSDLLDGQHGSYFQNATNLNAGTVADARLTSRIGQYAATVTDWDLATTNGWYMGFNIPNAPTASVWYIGDVVAHNNLWATQTVYAFTGDNSSNTQTWRRDSSDSGGTRVWGSWYKLQLSQAEQDARYATVSGSANYIHNTTSPQTANINITGTVTASGFSGSGSGLTNLSASNLSSGTINTARVSGAYTGITAVGTLSDITVNGAAIVNGAISRTDNNTRTYKHVHTANVTISNATGTMAFVMPKGWSNTMLRMSIKGYDYTSNTGAWEVVVGGYNYAVAPGWINSSVEIRGKAPFNDVRLGYNGTNTVLLLGNTSTVWQYSKVTVDEITAGFSNIDGWGEGWTSSLVASESGYTNVVSPTVLKTVYDVDLAGYVQLQGSTPGTAQIGNINVSGTVIASGFSGSGSGLTNLSASNLSSGTINTARVSGAYTGITGTGALAAGSISSGFGTIATTNTIQGSQLISTVATGTAPLTVTSTTRVNNLNADLLDGLNSTAFAASSGSGNYIQNTTGAQTANFNITGNGTVGGVMTIGSSSTRKVVEADSASSNVTFGQASTTDTFTRLFDPSGTPQGETRDTAFSGDGNYVAMVTDAYNDPLGIFKRTGDTFTRLPNPATLPPDSSYGVAFSNDGIYLSVVSYSSPYITIYKRSGDTFTKLANPATLPPDVGVSTAFSPDGLYLTVTHVTSPFFTIYKRSGDTFTKLANPVTLPPDTADGVAFSPDGAYMSVGISSSPYIAIYKRSGDRFTKVADPASLPPSYVYNTAFSPDGQYLSLTHNISPFVTIYKRSGDTFTKLANPATLPTGVAISSAFSPNGKYLTVTHDVSPFITTYLRSGDTFTKLANPASLPTLMTRGASYSPDSQYLSVGPAGTNPRLIIYRIGSGNSSNLTLNGAFTSTGAIQGSSLDITGYTNLQGGAAVAGQFNLQGEATFIQQAGSTHGVRIFGKASPALGDAPIFSVDDANGAGIFTVKHDVGRMVVVRGGNNFWGTAALDVGPDAGNVTAVQIRGATGQTAALLRVTDVSNNQLFGVGSNGSVTVNMLSGKYFQGGDDAALWDVNVANTVGIYGAQDAAQGCIRLGNTGVSTVCGNGSGQTHVGGQLFANNGLAVTGGTTFNNAIWLAAPGADNGIYLCHRGADNLLIRAWSGCSTVSSIRHKENVVSLDGSTALELLGRLRPVGFDWKAGTGTAMDGSIRDYGLIAEEVQGVLPHVVAYGANGEVTGLNYQGFIPFLMQAIKEQQSQITMLQGGNPTFTTLTVNGPATVRSLTVTGDADFKGNLTVAGTVKTGDIIVNGHLMTSGEVPLVSKGSVLGTVSSELNIDGTDAAGTLSIKSGGGSATGIVAHVEFLKYTAGSYKIVLSPVNSSAADIRVYVVKTTKGFDIVTKDVLTPGEVYEFDYISVGVKNDN